MENITSAKQILNIVKDTGTRTIRLLGVDGNLLVAGNNAKIKIDQRAAEMEKILKSAYFPDGTYFLELYQSSAAKPTKIPILKGNSGFNGNIPVTVTHLSENSNTDQSKILELTEKLNKLEALLNDPDNDFDDDDDDDDDEPESKFDWIKDCIKAIAPAIDKHFELSERKISLDENKFLSEKNENSEAINYILFLLNFIGENCSPEKAKECLNFLQSKDAKLFNTIISKINGSI